MHARVTAYRGKLVLELLAKASSEDVATSLDRPGNIGQVIMHTDRNLGVSEEAIALMKKVRSGRDSIGDIDWFKSNQGDVFGWIGGPCALVDAATCEAARGFAVRSYVSIANDVPEGARAAIDHAND